jgi:hypothetical protein
MVLGSGDLGPELGSVESEKPGFSRLGPIEQTQPPKKIYVSQEIYMFDCVVWATTP